MTDQTLRHQYLAMMGVDSWLPRVHLSGAAPSAEWVWDFSYPSPEIPFNPVEGGAQDAPKNTSDTSNARANLRQSMQSLGSAPKVSAPKARSTKDVLAQFNQPDEKTALKDAPEKPKHALEQEPEQAVSSSTSNSPSNRASSSHAAKSAPPMPATPMPAPPLESAHVDNSKPPPKFRLGFMRLGPLLIIDSLPTQGQQGVSDGHLNLAKGIARAINLSWEHDGRAPSQLPWPAFKRAAVSQDYVAAYQTVQHKLAKELEQGGVTHVLLMGQSAAHMLLDRTEPLDALRNLKFTLTGGVEARVTFSLSEAMQLPGVKRDIWQDVQPMLSKPVLPKPVLSKPKSPTA